MTTLGKECPPRSLAELAEHHQLIRDEAQAVALRIQPFAAEADERDDVDHGVDDAMVHVVDALRESGLYARSVLGRFGAGSRTWTRWRSARSTRP